MNKGWGDGGREKEERKLNKLGQVQGGGSRPGKMAREKARKEQKRAEQAAKADEESRERLVAAVLTGVNRAFPFANTDDDK